MADGRSGERQTKATKIQNGFKRIRPKQAKEIWVRGLARSETVESAID